MRLDEGSETVNSIAGSLFSLLLVAMMLFYTQLKVDILIKKKDANVVFTT